MKHESMNVNLYGLANLKILHLFWIQDHMSVFLLNLHALWLN